MSYPDGNGDYVQIDNRDGAIAVSIVRVDENGEYEDESDRYDVIATVEAGGSYYFDPDRYNDGCYYQFELASVPESYEIEYRGSVDGNYFNSFEDCVVGDDYVSTLICYPDGGSSWMFDNHDQGYLRITSTLH